MSDDTALIKRKFQFVPYGESSPAWPSLSCDGKVPGTTMDLTHWTNNETPDSIYADTSTEIALNFAHARAVQSAWREHDDAVVVNNHYDVDGVLSVYACVNPKHALTHRALMIAAAEAGDFGEWSSDDGVKLELAIGALEDDSLEDSGYASALEMAPSLLEDINAHEHLWRDDWNRVQSSWDLIRDGVATVEVIKVGDDAGHTVAVVTQPIGTSRVDSRALHRELRDTHHACGMSGDDAALRVLRATMDDDKRFTYEWEKPGYGWVGRLKDRKPAGEVDAEKLVEKMNLFLQSAFKAGTWETGGDGGLVSICKSDTWTKTTPGVVARTLSEIELALRE